MSAYCGHQFNSSLALELSAHNLSTSLVAGRMRWSSQMISTLQPIIFVISSIVWPIEISNELGLAYQWLNDIENIIGLEQEKFSDVFNGHPNAVIVHHLSKQPNSNIKTFKGIKKLEN